MLLYACASCILGWSTLPGVASRALEVRGADVAFSSACRFLLAAFCVLGACASWACIYDAVPCVSFTLACVCMAALVACDLKERVLPTELVFTMLAFAIVFRMSMNGVLDCMATAVPAAALAASILLLNKIRGKEGKPVVFGSGDARMIVPLALFCGTSGAAFGMLAFAVAAGVSGVIGMVSAHRSIPLAPSLAACFFTGTLLPLL